MKSPTVWTLVLRALGLETPRPMVASGELSDAERLELARYLDHQEERTRVVVKRLVFANVFAVALIGWLVLGSAASDFEEAVGAAVAAESVTARAGLARETAAWRAALEERTELVLARAREAADESLVATADALEDRVRERGQRFEAVLAETAALATDVEAAEREVSGARARASAVGDVLDALERQLTGEAPAPRETLDDSVRAIAAAFDKRAAESRALDLWLRADETSLVAFGRQRSVIAARATGFTGGTLRSLKVTVWDPALEPGAGNGVTLGLGGAETLTIGQQRYEVELVAALDRQEASLLTEGNAVQLRITALP